MYFGALNSFCNENLTKIINLKNLILPDLSGLPYRKSEHGFQKKNNTNRFLLPKSAIDCSLGQMSEVNVRLLQLSKLVIRSNYSSLFEE